MNGKGLGALGVWVAVGVASAGCDRCSGHATPIDAGVPTAVPTVVPTLPSLEPPPEEDAGVVDAGTDAAKKGVVLPTNVTRLKQCCAQLAVEARKLGASPEAGILLGAAGQCNALVSQAGASGTAPELGAIRTALKGRTVPPVCAGF